MLHAFTWEQFGFAMLLLLLIYYGWFIARIGVQRIKSIPISGSPDSVVGILSNISSPEIATAAEQNEPASILGKAKLPEGVTLLASSELSFSPEEHDYRYDQIGMVPDLLEDLKDLFKEISDEDGQKLDFLQKMGDIREDYPGIATHPQLKAINEFIAQNAPFSLSVEELQNLWD